MCRGDRRSLVKIDHGQLRPFRKCNPHRTQLSRRGRWHTARAAELKPDQKRETYFQCRSAASNARRPPRVNRRRRSARRPIGICGSTEQPQGGPPFKIRDMDLVLRITVAGLRFSLHFASLFPLFFNSRSTTSEVAAMPVFLNLVLTLWCASPTPPGCCVSLV
jgi:hypothetical protein